MTAPIKITVPGKRRGNKFGAVKTVVDGITFDSKREATRYSQLRLLEKAGAIRGLKLQPVFPLTIDGEPIKIRSKGYPNGRRCKYTADFAYFDERGRVVEEVKGGYRRKGTDDEAARLRRAVVEAIYRIRIDLV